MRRYWCLSFGLLTVLVGCRSSTLSGGETSPTTLTLSTITPYTVQSSHQLIGGPQSAGREGDVILSNDIIRLVIQQYGRYPGISSFGGNIIDADWVRPSMQGEDQFGYMWPLVNIEWTINGLDIMAFESFDLDQFLGGTLTPLADMLPDGETPVIVVRGVIDVYDYLDLDFLEPIAHATTGQTISYDPQFDDLFAPFQSTALRGIRPETYTLYRLPKHESYVEITTTIFNDGDEPVTMPVGDFLNGSGALQLLIPGLGFSPPLEEQLLGDTPAVIYVADTTSLVSYGYFYRFEDFLTASTDEKASTGTQERLASASISYSGVTGMMFGESFPKIFPIGAKQSPSINFTIPEKSRRSYTRYFVLGNRSAGSVLDTGLRALDIPRHSVSGWVVDTEGKGVDDAEVAILGEAGKTIVTYRVDGKGRFSGYLSDGSTPFARAFGTGVYTLRVEKRGHHAGGTADAGVCTPSTIDMRQGSVGKILCRLGKSGVVQFSGPMTDAVSQRPMPVRLTIVGADPSPDRALPGIFMDTTVHYGPYGVVQFRYLNAAGGVDESDTRWLRLEPGYYLFVYSRGPEYALKVDPVEVSAYGVTSVTPGTLQRVMPTVGYVAADFHIHAAGSPDSWVPPVQRVLAAAGEGLDILHSSDHDFYHDYGDEKTTSAARAWVPDRLMATVVGVEITPNNMGHIQAFPLVHDAAAPGGGAFNWSLHPKDRDDPSPDFQLSVQEILDAMRTQYGSDVVLQMNHISDLVLSLLNIPGTVTSPHYRESDQVEPLSVYTNPLMSRAAGVFTGDPPFAWGTTPFTSKDFTAVELTIGPELNGPFLWETGLPQWFNLLNLGLLWTATSNSDSHTVHRPIGMPRNFVASEVDPADGLGEFAEFDAAAYARAINDHRVVASAGPFITFTAVTEKGEHVAMGETVRARGATIQAKVVAPSWAWFDTIEIYANTEPDPVDDDGVSVLEGIAATPDTFFAPYRRPKFSYQPMARYRLRDGTLSSWQEQDGLITATVELPMTFAIDTWVVVVARGTQKTEGFRSIFPMATFDHAEAGVQPPCTGHFGLEEFYTDPQLEMPAWAFTNPIFFDVDGDANNDGEDFEGLWLKRGWSPVR
ncbi:MAG: CehA/McbA family metallohydrolase [Deltaproteobacteria bacterium]|nr:CehA/McbA family metallohydrolase [Deltaproteobacteria bacterium]